MGFVVCLGARLAGLCPGASAQRQVGLVNFYRAGQLVALRANHRTAESVQHRPGSLVTAQAKNPLQSKSAHAVLLTRDVPRRGKPNPQGRSRLVEDGARRDTALVRTGSTNQSAPACANRCVHHATCRAAKSARPPQLLKVAGTRIFTGKPVFKLHPCFGVIATGDGIGISHPIIFHLVELNG